MKRAMLIAVTLAASCLTNMPQPAFASGYDVCTIEADVICAKNAVDEDDKVRLGLRFRVTATPDCRGHGIKTIETNQVFDANVQLDEGMNAEAIGRGTHVTLRYEYHEGLTPDGFQSGEDWTLLSFEAINNGQSE